MHVFKTFAISSVRKREEWNTSRDDELVIRRRTGTQGKFIGRSFFCDAWDFHDPRIMEWGIKCEQFRHSRVTHRHGISVKRSAHAHSARSSPSRLHVRKVLSIWILPYKTRGNNLNLKLRRFRFFSSLDWLATNATTPQSEYSIYKLKNESILKNNIHRIILMCTCVLK